MDQTISTPKLLAMNLTIKVLNCNVIKDANHIPENTPKILMQILLKEQKNHFKISKKSLFCSHLNNYCSLHHMSIVSFLCPGQGSHTPRRTPDESAPDW